MLKLFEWMKIFESTALYISLIEQTIIDISSFMLIYLVAILAVGLSTMFLVILSKNEDEDQSSAITSVFRDAGVMKTNVTGLEMFEPGAFLGDFLEQGLWIQY